ncbi:MAG: polysialyltransferase family glycosyltransferase, partial [Brevibacterium sp.]
VKARGLSTVIFKPHPTSARTTTEPLRKRSHELGLEFVLADVPLLAEIVIATTQPQLVVSCYSTGLATARALFGTATAAIGTSMMLQVLTPYQNSNRIPLTIVDALHTGGHALQDLGPLIDAVTYCMQSETASHLRGNAIEFLESAVSGEDMKYFKRKRLSKLDLPGQLEIPRHRKGLSSAKRRLRSQAKRAQHTLKTYGISIDAPKLVPKVRSTLNSKLSVKLRSEPDR